ncbi:hypothetical protein [Xanthomonas arboricola]|uniref:hypothetical protein n=1 Tax=Xanthomonas arboricola TaxID=56448 RepID=UPI004040B5A3
MPRKVRSNAPLWTDLLALRPKFRRRAGCGIPGGQLSIQAGAVAVRCVAMGTLTPTQSSERMARVRAEDTKPEMVVKRLVHSMGYRYRLHVDDLAGRPDLYFQIGRP